ncbi:MAG: hypothetical protein H6906_06035 [Hyphomicrobiales bacterium]|nr:hypothetical protein [Hyphomicrobiales bacterium]
MVGRPSSYVEDRFAATWPPAAAAGDFLLISENDSEEDMLAALLTVTSTGTVSDLRTVPALTTVQAKAVYEKGHEIRGRFKPLGAGD